MKYKHFTKNSTVNYVGYRDVGGSLILQLNTYTFENFYVYFCYTFDNGASLCTSATRIQV